MSKQRAKGTKFETEVVNYLRDMGFTWVQRTGSRDYGAGDIEGLADWLVECKNHREIHLAEFIDQAAKAADRVVHQPFPMVVVKRRNRPAKDAYVVMPLWAFAEGVL